jgi:hypothetical protein
MSVDSNYNSQFLQIDFRLLDNRSFLAFVNQAEFATYLILRRYVWRGGVHRLGLHDLYHQQQKLASSIGAPRVAEMLGLRDTTRVSKHLSYLVELGVVKRLRTGRENIFVLGEWYQPPGWQVSKEYYYLDNCFGVDNSGPPGPSKSDLAQKAKSDLHPAPTQSWPKEPSSNREENKETNTVNGNHSPVKNLPDVGHPHELRELLATDIIEQLGDSHSLRFYQLVADKVPETVIREALSQIRSDGANSPAKVFTHRMTYYAVEQLKKRVG